MKGAEAAVKWKEVKGHARKLRGKGDERTGRAPMPGRFAETVGLDSCWLRRQLEFFSLQSSPHGQLDFFFLGLGWRKRGRVEASMPGRWRARYRSLHVGGLAWLRCRAGGAAGMWRARYRSLHVAGLARLGQECDAGKHKWHLCFRSGRVAPRQSV